MSKVKEKSNLFESSHLMLLVCYTIFSIILIAESLLLGWEKWALVLIVFGMGSAWVLHIRHTTPPAVRLWLYAILMMGCYFFYGIHRTSTFDLALVMSGIIIIHTLTGRKSLITLCEFTFIITMIYELASMAVEGSGTAAYQPPPADAFFPDASSVLVEKSNENVAAVMDERSSVAPSIVYLVLEKLYQSFSPSLYTMYIPNVEPFPKVSVEPMVVPRFWE